MESYHSLMVEGGAGCKFPLLTQGVEGNSTDYSEEPGATLYRAMVGQEQVVSEYCGKLRGFPFRKLSCINHQIET